MPDRPVTFNKCAAEIVGTFALVFIGTGTIVVHQQNQMAGLVGIALAFGLVIMAMVYSIGAHMNPAVTISLTAAGKSSPAAVVPFIVCQLIGAFIATALVRFIFSPPANSDLGSTLIAPGYSVGQIFALEVILTFFLLFVILSVSSGPKESAVFTGVAVGGTIIVDILAGGAISGASMNPARSLAPALVSGHTANLWVYMIAPVLGGLLAVPAYFLTRQRPA